MMAWGDAARESSLASRRAQAQLHAQSNGIAHQRGVGAVGQRVLDVVRNSPAAFSVSTQGDEPKHGYMVSVPGRTQEVNANAMKANPRAILQGYARKNAALLRRPGAYIGGWTDSKTGRTHLDVSNRIERRDNAVRAGKIGNQIAIWDVKRKREIRTGGKGDFAK